MQARRKKRVEVSRREELDGSSIDADHLASDAVSVWGAQPAPPRSVRRHLIYGKVLSCTPARVTATFACTCTSGAV